MEKRVYDCVNRLLNKNRNKDYINASKKMIEDGVYILPPYGEFKLNTVEWSVSDNRSVLRLVHGNTFLGDLIKAYEDTNDLIYINWALKIVKSWIISNSSKKNDKNIYHDETTALRLNYWISFYNVAKNILLKEELQFLKQEMHNTAKLLSTKEFHSGNNNHGMFQDISLLIYSLYIDDENSNYYKHLAINRLVDYFVTSFTSEGVHKEQTPSYHYLISNKIKSLLELFSVMDENNYKKLEYLYNKTQEFSTYIIKPDGNVPQIGDNSSEDIPLKSYGSLYCSEEYKYAITAGTQGKVPQKNIVVLKESGYTIIRDDWNKKSNAFYILFTCAYNSNYHKHCDDLSLIIYKDGDIITESGPNGYNYQDEYTKYAYSGFAHNTLIVNNESLPRVDGKFNEVFIREYTINEGLVSITGVNKRYNDVTHIRELIYNMQSSVKVIDSVKSDKENIYDLYWNLDSSIRYYKQDREIYLFRQKKWIGTITFNSDSDLGIEIIYGSEGENNLGWNFPKMGEKRKNFTIKVRSISNELNITTDINIFNEGKGIEEFMESVDYKYDYDFRQYIKDGYIIAEVVDFDINESSEFAYYVYYDGNVIFKSLYSNNRLFRFKLENNGFYSVRVFGKFNGKIVPKSATNRLLFGEKTEYGLTYYYEEADKSSDNLVVVFSSMNEKNDFRYSYFNLVRNIKECNKLFILDKFGVQGSYYLGQNKKKNIEKDVNRLIDNIIDKNYIDRKKVLLCGSSKGAYAALYQTIKYNYPYCVIGAPQYYLGNFLIDEAKHLEVAKYISGGVSKSSKVYLNNIMRNLIESCNKVDSKIHIHISKNEYHYRRHFVYLYDLLKKKNINVYVDYCDYNNHSDLKEYFPRYLEENIKTIFDLDI